MAQTPEQRRQARTANAQKHGYQTYGAYDYARRNKRAREHGAFKNYGDKRKRKKLGLPSPAQELAKRIADQLGGMKWIFDPRTGHLQSAPTDEFEADQQFDWELFRTLYNRLYLT